MRVGDTAGERSRGDVASDLPELLGASPLGFPLVSLGAHEGPEMDEARPCEAELLNPLGDPPAGLGHRRRRIV